MYCALQLASKIDDASHADIETVECNSIHAR